MDINSIENVYFIGAGGIGMAALERYFLARGCRVAGYDRTTTDLTDALESEGVALVTDDDPALIPSAMRNPANTLVVYTPAVPDTHRALGWFRDSAFTVMKRAEVLGLVTRHSSAICFAGTHGKTTTSSMAAWLLQTEGTGSNAFLGGVLRNTGSNLMLSATSPLSVVEADEYDRSFHRLRPHIAVITSASPDHLDIYGTKEAYLESFARFTELIDPDGTLLIHEGLEVEPRTAPGVKTLTYSRDSGDYHAANIVTGNGTITFDLVRPGSDTITGIELGVPVDINISNAVAALAAVDIAGHLDPESARKAMKSFLGAKRRFEKHLESDGCVIIDDYAHHPDELRASISSVKALYPDRKLTVAFQPHLYSRTRDFAPDFARALSEADEVVVLDIYPAREQPIPGVTSALILDAVTSPVKTAATKTDLAMTLKNLNFEVLLTAGAGDIATVIPDIIKARGL